MSADHKEHSVPDGSRVKPLEGPRLQRYASIIKRASCCLLRFSYSKFSLDIKMILTSFKLVISKDKQFDGGGRDEQTVARKNNRYRSQITSHLNKVECTKNQINQPEGAIQESLTAPMQTKTLPVGLATTKNQLPTQLERRREVERDRRMLQVFRRPKLVDLSRYAELSVPLSERNLLQTKLYNHQALPSVNSDIRQYLPSGPPPFRPSKLALTSSVLLDKLKDTLLFKKMYKSQIYYLFLDVLRQLNLLANQLVQNKAQLSQLKWSKLAEMLNRLTWKGGDMLKLKWPLVMLNPNFLRELLSNPTFLVMLFHAIEVGYTSMPLKGLLLKPFVKMVAQRGPEEEEEIWWRRKRLFDTIHGLGASELEPNLKTKHFRNPGKQAKLAFPKVGKIINQLAPLDSGLDYTVSQKHEHPVEDYGMSTYPHQQQVPPGSSSSSESYMSGPQEEAFLENQLGDHKQQQPVYLMAGSHSTPANVLIGNYPGKPVGNQLMTTMDLMNQNSWLMGVPSREQLLTREEFNQMDDRDKKRLLEEARLRFEESSWTNEIIKQHDDFIDSLKSNPNNQFEVGLL